jgi:hypothetical protein
MPAGLQIFNDNNVLQIDSTYRNYALVRAGKFTGGAGGSAALNLSGLSRFALWAVVPAGYPGISPNTGGWYNGARWFSYWFLNSISSVPVQYYVFDIVTPTGATFGLEVYDENGQLVFDGEGHPMKIVSDFLSENAATGLPRNISIPGGKSYAVAPLYGGRWEQDDGVGGDYESDSTYVYRSGQQLVFFTQYFSDPVGGSAHDWGTRALYGLVIDVTGLPLNYSRAV